MQCGSGRKVVGLSPWRRGHGHARLGFAGGRTRDPVTHSRDELIVVGRLRLFRRSLEHGHIRLEHAVQALHGWLSHGAFALTRAE